MPAPGALLHSLVSLRETEGFFLKLRWGAGVFNPLLPIADAIYEAEALDFDGYQTADGNTAHLVALCAGDHASASASTGE